MKKIITKLALRRETVRTLRDSELAAAVVGGNETNCTALSRMASTCIPPAIVVPTAPMK